MSQPQDINPFSNQQRFWTYNIPPPTADMLLAGHNLSQQTESASPAASFLQISQDAENANQPVVLSDDDDTDAYVVSQQVVPVPIVYVVPQMPMVAPFPEPILSLVCMII